MSEYQRFERKSLEGMAGVDGWGQTPLAEQKKVIKAVWQHLNKKTRVKKCGCKKGAGALPPSNIPKGIRRAFDVLKIYSGAKTAYELGKLVVPMIL